MQSRVFIKLIYIYIYIYIYILSHIFSQNHISLIKLINYCVKVFDSYYFSFFFIITDCISSRYFTVQYITRYPCITRVMCEIHSKLAIATPERHQLQISHTLLTLGPTNKYSEIKNFVPGFIKTCLNNNRKK